MTISAIARIIKISGIPRPNIFYFTPLINIADLLDCSFTLNDHLVSRKDKLRVYVMMYRV
ncbi:MAG: hypothetical protein K8S13_24620, partial [Desulfobacula sp.]|uniref:hypothetical protein n=1 Tax=Desulfobacula sp. TaxID=2593537 RepID=UPI0025C67D48